MRVVITGANRGIGAALARQYAESGAEVIRAARGDDAADLGDAGRRVPLDVADAASVAALADGLAGQPIDLLIANAGIIGPDRQTCLDMDFDGFLQTLEVNVLGPLRVVQALLPNLRAASGAKVAVMSSILGSFQGPAYHQVAYCVSKAATNKLFQSLAAELAPEGIAVAALHPGWVRTAMGGDAAPLEPEQSAAGIRSVLDEFSIATTGKFLDYTGKELPW